MDVLSCVGAEPGGKPFETFGKDSGYKLRRRKHGTTDRLALPHQHRLKGEIAETVRSAPGRDPRMRRVIRIFPAQARFLARFLAGFSAWFFFAGRLTMSLAGRSFVHS